MNNKIPLIVIAGLFILALSTALIKSNTLNILPAEKTLNEHMVEQLSTKHQINPEVIIVETKTQEGNHAVGTINFMTGGGAMWFAVKTDLGWELVFDGNGIITCDIANKYAFPKSIVSGCVDTVNGGEFVIR